jgi:hypothetical protein
MDEVEESSDRVEYEFNLDNLAKASITDLRQEGNFLIGTTNTGITFRHHIPVDKILDKVNGKFVLRDIAISS